jgi:hypothetical protein
LSEAKQFGLRVSRCDGKMHEVRLNGGIIFDEQRLEELIPGAEYLLRTAGSDRNE